MTDSKSASPPQAWYALAVLLLAYILSFIDRNVMAVLIGPIRADFDISDFQYSLLHGFAFSIFYIVLGLPIARLADRSNRKWIITIGVFFWSVMTCVCGAARSFSMLFLARIGVGVGEAALSPPAFSLLGDMFDADKLPRAISIFSLGITLGGGLAYIIGGFVYEYFANSAAVILPLAGEIRPWQMTFIVVGAPGFIVVVLLSFMKEPTRIGALTPTPATPAATSPPPQDEYSLAEVVQHLKDNRRAYGSLMGAMSLLAILGYGTMAWYPEFLIRSFGTGRAEAGSQFGLIFLVAGSIGTIVGGWSVKPLTNRGYRDAPLRIILVVAALWLIPACLGPLAPSATLALIAACPIVFCLNAYFGVAVAGLQFITPNRMRAQISALLLFLTNFFGLALGPSIVALLTDFVFGDDQSLRYSLLLLPLLICPAAIALLASGLGAYRQTRQAVEARE